MRVDIEALAPVRIIMDTRNKVLGILGTLALLLGWPSPPAAAQPAADETEPVRELLGDLRARISLVQAAYTMAQEGTSNATVSEVDAHVVVAAHNG